MKHNAKKKLIISGIVAAVLIASIAGILMLQQANQQTDTTLDSTQTQPAIEVDLSDITVSIQAEDDFSLVVNDTATANLNASATVSGLPEGGQILLFYAASNDTIMVDAEGNVTAIAASAVAPFVTITAKYDADGDGVADSAETLARLKVSVSVS